MFSIVQYAINFVEDVHALSTCNCLPPLPLQTLPSRYAHEVVTDQGIYKNLESCVCGISHLNHRNFLWSEVWKYYIAELSTRVLQVKSVSQTPIGWRILRNHKAEEIRLKHYNYTTWHHWDAFEFRVSHNLANSMANNTSQLCDNFHLAVSLSGAIWNLILELHK